MYLRSFLVNNNNSGATSSSTGSTSGDVSNTETEVESGKGNENPDDATVTESSLTTLEEYLALNKEKNGPIVIT